MSTPDLSSSRHNTVESPIEVEISSTQTQLDLDAPALVSLVERVLRGEGIPRAQISLALVDDVTIRRINKQHLDHDWPTDVISFPLSEPGDAVLAGELVISAEMAQATAVELQVDPAAELALYVVHGLLHLCGYDDGSDTDILRMRRREDEVLRREGLANTFALVERQEPDHEGREQAPCSV
jgi:probable rRNA maturation factor